MTRRATGIEGLDIRPLTAARMDDLGRVLRGGWGAGCWCMYPRLTTVLARRHTFHAEVLSSHVTPYSTEVAERLAQMQAYFESQGADATTAMMRAYAALSGLIEQQAAVLSFVDAFHLLGVVFLAMTPLLFLMKRPGGHREAGPAVLE